MTTLACGQVAMLDEGTSSGNMMGIVGLVEPILDKSSPGICFISGTGPLFDVAAL